MRILPLIFYASAQPRGQVKLKFYKLGKGYCI